MTKLNGLDLTVLARSVREKDPRKALEKFAELIDAAQKLKDEELTESEKEA